MGKFISVGIVVSAWVNQTGQKQQIHQNVVILNIISS